MLTRSGATCAALLAAALGTPSAAQQTKDSESTEAREGPQTCLSHPSIRRTRILDDRNIVFVTRHETIYNNQLPKACASLRRDSLVNYAVAHRRMCAGDHFQVLQETSPGNYVPAFLCQLGPFVPITEDELETLTAMTEPNRERRSRRRSPREAITTEQVELPAAPVEPAASAPAETPSTPVE
jgi:hypothetical protein